jgi:hypothetical protein
MPRDILRDRRFSTTACPDCWAMGPNEFEIVYGEEKIFCTVLTRAPRKDKNL